MRRKCSACSARVKKNIGGYSDLKSITEVVNRGELFKFMEKPWDDVVLLETLREAFRLFNTRSERRVNKA